MKKEFIDVSDDIIDISGEKEVNELIIKNCPNLLNVEANNCAIKKLVIEDVPLLNSLSIYANNFRRLDISDLPNLRYLNVGFNILALLDIQNCPKLETLYCNRNNLYELDFSHLTNLKSLYCHDNKWLKKLNVSGLINLRNLFCQECSLETINVDGTDNLENIDLAENKKLTNFDLEKKIHLQNLSCRYTLIKELNLPTNCKWLKNLYIFGNKITKLDLGKCVPNDYLVIMYSFPPLIRIEQLKQIILSSNVNALRFALPRKNMAGLYIRKNNSAQKHDTSISFLVKDIFQAPLSEEEVIQIDDEMRDNGSDGLIKVLKPHYTKKYGEDEGYESDKPDKPDNDNLPTFTYNPLRKNDFTNLDLSHWKLTGRLIIEDWPKLRTLNVGNNQLQDLIVRNCPKLNKLIYAHNKMKKTATIENCPQLKHTGINFQNYRGDLDWQKNMSEEDKAYQQERVEQMKLIEEINDEVVALLEKEKQGQTITLEEVVKLLDKIKYKDWILFKYRKPFADLCDRLLKKKPDPNQSPPKKPSELPTPQEQPPAPKDKNKDQDQITHDLQEQINQLKAKSGKKPTSQQQVEEIKKEIEKTREKIIKSNLDENKKKELLKLLEELANKNKNITDNNSVDTPSPSHNYNLVWIPVLIGQAILLSALIYASLKRITKKAKKV